MAINRAQAMQIAEKMIKQSRKKLCITAFESIDYVDGDGLFIFCVQDQDTGRYYYPGELFKAIRKSDGQLVDFELPPPTF
jgi:hypothetical protein